MTAFSLNIYSDKNGLLAFSVPMFFIGIEC